MAHIIEEYVTVPVSVECPDVHADELLDDIQRIFDEHGPLRDRGTDWTRCMEEPWASLVEAMLPNIYTESHSGFRNGRIQNVKVNGSYL